MLPEMLAMLTSRQGGENPQGDPAAYLYPVHKRNASSRDGKGVPPLMESDSHSEKQGLPLRKYTVQHQAQQDSPSSLPTPASPIHRKSGLIQALYF